jgi:hypothetical protein
VANQVQGTLQASAGPAAYRPALRTDIRDHAIGTSPQVYAGSQGSSG